MRQIRIPEKITLITIILLGTILRLIDIAQPFSGLYKWNEGHYSVTALNYYNYGIFLPMNEYGLDLTTTPLFSWLIHASFRIFGVSELAARIPSLIFGLISLILLYYIAERLYDKKVAVASTLIASISPGIVYLSRNVQLESMFTAFSLAALLLLIKYKDTKNSILFIGSSLALSIAILTKYPAILSYPVLIWVWFTRGNYVGEKTEKLRLIIYLTFPLIPVILWTYLAFSLSPDLSIWYISKSEAPWALEKALNSLYQAFTNFIPEHFGFIFYYPFILALPFLLLEMRRHSTIIIFTVSWLALIFFFPEFYLNNSYYHYTMLYGISILLGYFIIKIGGNLVFKPNFSRKTVFLTVAIAVFFSLYQYNSFFHSYYTDFSVTNETEPFFSAKHVARENIIHAPVIADFPMTMFYLGGDPEYINLAYNDQSLIKAVESQKYTYVVTYYLGNRTLRDALEENRYEQIAPRAWRKLE